MRRLVAKGALTGSLILVLAASGCATSGDVPRRAPNRRKRCASPRRPTQKATAAAADAAAARAAADAAAEEARKASEKADRIFQRSLHK